MITPFSVLESEFFPSVNAEIARRLLREGKTQNEIAQCLGVSQAMVSRYLQGRTKSDALVSEFSRAISERILNGASRDEIIKESTELCLAYLSRGDFSGILKNRLAIEDENLFSNLRMGSNRKLVVDNIRNALKILGKKDLSAVFPQVRMNVAMITSDGESIKDIAAIPGRLTLVHGKIKSYEEPEFGASHYLSNLLLETRKRNMNMRAVANIKYSEGIVRKLIKIGLRPSSKLGSDVFVDKGGIGIEPQIYIFGSDAIEVCSRIARLL